MSIWLDIKYLRRISSNLERFKEIKITPYEASVRCPICGDSKKSKSKTRGRFHEYSGSIYYKCFNCMFDGGLHLSQFLSSQFPAIYNEYRFEEFSNTIQPKKKKSEFNDQISLKIETSRHIINEKNAKLLTGTIPILDLPEDHYARRYIESRKLPEKYINMIYFVDKFFAWANKSTDKFNASSINKDQPRIIIPWYSSDGEIFTYQARALHGEDPKYYTITLNESIPKIFGLQHIDYTEKIYTFEGPIDSLFIKNSVAVGCADLISFGTISDNVIYCSDNEPRSREITRVIKKNISLGCNVFIPPQSWKFKDINDAIIAGHSSNEIKSIIDNNTFSGLKAHHVFNKWCKI